MSKKINFHYTRTLQRKKFETKREGKMKHVTDRQILFEIIKIFFARPALFHKSQCETFLCYAKHWLFISFSNPALIEGISYVLL